jgi:hypothetical protein
MRIYIIGNDGITLGRTAPTTLNDAAAEQKRQLAPPQRITVEGGRPLPGCLSHQGSP